MTMMKTAQEFKEAADELIELDLVIKIETGEGILKHFIKLKL